MNTFYRYKECHQISIFQSTSTTSSPNAKSRGSCRNDCLGSLVPTPNEYQTIIHMHCLQDNRWTMEPESELKPPPNISHGNRLKLLELAGIRLVQFAWSSLKCVWINFCDNVPGCNIFLLLGKGWHCINNPDPSVGLMPSNKLMRLIVQQFTSDESKRESRETLKILVEAILRPSISLQPFCKTMKCYIGCH